MKEVLRNYRMSFIKARSREELEKKITDEIAKTGDRIVDKVVIKPSLMKRIIAFIKEKLTDEVEDDLWCARVTFEKSKSNEQEFEELSSEIRKRLSRKYGKLEDILVDVKSGLGRLNKNKDRGIADSNVSQFSNRMGKNDLEDVGKVLSPEVLKVIKDVFENRGKNVRKRKSHIELGAENGVLNSLRTLEGALVSNKSSSSNKVVNSTSPNKVVGKSEKSVDVKRDSDESSLLNDRNINASTLQADVKKHDSRELTKAISLTGELEKIVQNLADVVNSVEVISKSSVLDKDLNLTVLEKEVIRKGLGRYGLSEDEKGIELLLSRVVRKRLITYPPVAMMFVGSTGVGKTTTIQKITLKLREMDIAASKLVIVTLDTFKIGANRQMEAFGKATVIAVKQFVDFTSFVEWFSDWKERDGGWVLVDTPGVNSLAESDWGYINAAVERDLEVILCLAATDKFYVNRSIIDKAMEKLSGKIGGVIITKLDEVENLLQVLPILVEVDEKLSGAGIYMFTTGQSLQGGILVPDVVKLKSYKKLI